MDDEIHEERWVDRVVRQDLEVLAHVLTGLAELGGVDRHSKIRGLPCGHSAACGLDDYAGAQRHFSVDQVHVVVLLGCDPEVAVIVERQARAGVVSPVRVLELVDYGEGFHVDPIDHVRSGISGYPQHAIGVILQPCYAHREGV